MSNKIYLGIITNHTETENIKELTEVYDSFDGLAVSYHGEKNECWEILNSRKKDGFIVHNDYFTNHAYAMNGFLFHPKVVPYLTWIFLRDSAERFNPSFANQLRTFVSQLEFNKITAVSNFSKLLGFQVQEGQFFNGSPHWGLQGLAGNCYPIDQSGVPEAEYAFSLRHKREESYIVKHHLKYYLYNHSNHMLLGRENDIPSFQKYEGLRREYKIFCRVKLQIENLTADNLIKFWKENQLSEDHRRFINQEAILNYAYHLHVKGTNYPSIKNWAEQKMTVDV